MKKLIIMLAYISLSTIIHAQLINNKINIYLSSTFGNFPGSQMVNDNGYITPSLYSNYNTVSFFSLKGVVNSKSNLSCGINYDFQSANDWSAAEFTDFENSEIQLHSFTPLVRIHNKFTEKGFSNKFRVFLEGGIQIGISKLSLTKSLFDIQTDDIFSSPPISDKNLFIGLRGTIGMEYSFSQRMGLFCNYSYDIAWVSSKLYNDNSLKRSIVNVGVVLKFKKDKYFYY